MYLRYTIATVGVVLVAILRLLLANTFATGPTQPETPPGAFIEIDEEGAAARLSEAVTYTTVSYRLGRPVEAQAFLDLHAFLVRSYPRVHATLEREIVSDYSLLYTWKGSDAALRPILLMGHMDVVPVEPGTEGEWERPPFSGDIADGFIWGRGTLDDKVSVLAALEAVEYLLGSGVSPARTVYLAFGHDEELDGPEGAAKIAQLLADRGVRLEFTLDEGMVIAHGIVPGVAKPVALIGVAEKGYLAITLKARGEGGHSSMPPDSTAIGRLARALHRLESNQISARLEAPVTDMFDFLAPEMPFAMRLAVTNRWLFEPLLISQMEGTPATNASIRTTTAVTMVTGGVKPNVLPSAAEAIADFRIMPSETVTQVIEHVRDAIDDPDVIVEQVDLANEPSRISDIGSWSFEALHKTVRQVFPDVVVAPSLVIAGTDSKHYAPIADNNYRFLPSRLRSEDLNRIHGDNDRISIANYDEIIRFYVQLLLNTAV